MAESSFRGRGSAREVMYESAVWFEPPSADPLAPVSSEDPCVERG